MPWFRRAPQGRHAQGRHAQGRPPDGAGVPGTGSSGVQPVLDTRSVPPARIAPPVAEERPHGVVRLVFADGSALALDPHDPRSRAFRALADVLVVGWGTDLLTSGAQGAPVAADPLQGRVEGVEPGERGRA